MTRQKNYFVDEVYTNLNFNVEPLPEGDYEDCSFTNCNFKEFKLSKHNFINCTFNSCDLSLLKLISTGIRGCHFFQCKLLGLHFEHAHSFGFSAHFKNCLLNLSSFYKISLRNSSFQSCQLHEVDFTEANLSGLSFAGCDLRAALFEGTNLEKVDFRGAVDFQIDPEKNRLYSAKFEIAGLPGLLSKYKLQID